MVVAGYHLIWTAYGCWLPNDPRGSTSKEVRNIQLQDLGELHFGRKRLQPARRVARRSMRKHGSGSSTICSTSTTAKPSPLRRPLQA
jgi:hypothetical protein